MTVIFNNPADFAEEQLEGFLDLYSDHLVGVPGGAVAHRGAVPQVAVIVGGGSGHYPAFCGLVGSGFASGAVVGNIFTSPSAAQVYSVAKAAHQGCGVVLTFGNYAGDVMNFGIAAELLNREGIATRIVLVTDDVASSEVIEQRRGIAGDFTVFKLLGAAAAAGHPLDEVERIGNAANAATRSIGVAFSGCTMPGAASSLFSVPSGQMGVGLGIHGEPGIRDQPLTTADELATLLVDGLLVAAPRKGPAKAAVLLNGLGTTKYEELFLLWRSIAPRLREAGLEIIEPEVGELVTSLDMGGCSLTVTWLDDEMDALWRADAYTPAYRKQRTPLSALTAITPGQIDEVAEIHGVATAAASSLGRHINLGMQLIAALLLANEDELGRIDAIAGDGDHGRGMVRGADAAAAAAQRSSELGLGVSATLTRSGRAWAALAGGTSGVLWGAGLEAAGNSLDDGASEFSAQSAGVAVRAFSTAITSLGGATLGDKTMVDALAPFVDTLESELAAGHSLARSWRASAAAATAAAANTAPMRPKLGRARPLADRSIGTPDAGATSLALIVAKLGGLFDTTETS